MIVKVKFSKPTMDVPVNNQKELNSYIHKCLGANNKFHDAFSDYCVSSLQGGKLDFSTGMLYFEDVPYILFTTNNQEFTVQFLNGIMKNENTLFGMHYDGFEFSDFEVSNYFDKVFLVSPLLLKIKDKKISVKDDNYLQLLKEHCIKKLAHNGIVDETFDIEIRNENKAKVKKIMVGDVFNICSMVSFIIKGKKETRLKLYNLGLGTSTGSGFGFVKIYKKGE